MQPLIDRYTKIVPPRIPIEAIASDFSNLVKTDKQLYSYGIDCLWLQERMDCATMSWLPKSLPAHAKVGIGVHAGVYGVEEDFLLRDAFFTLVAALAANKRMWSMFNEY